MEKLDSLVKEVIDIGSILDWNTHVFDDDIQGVSFTPKGSEPVFLTFNKEGRILSPFNIIAHEIYDNVKVDKELKFTTSTKTQFAGLDIHMAIISLLKYIAAKYLKEFTLLDEGYYWETDDKKILSDQFKKYNLYIDTVTDLFRGLKSFPGETPESVSNRLENILKEKWKDFNETN